MEVLAEKQQEEHEMAELVEDKLERLEREEEDQQGRDDLEIESEAGTVLKLWWWLVFFQQTLSVKYDVEQPMKITLLSDIFPLQLFLTLPGPTLLPLSSISAKDSPLHRDRATT